MKKKAKKKIKEKSGYQKVERADRKKKEKYELKRK